MDFYCHILGMWNWQSLSFVVTCHVKKYMHVYVLVEYSMARTTDLSNFLRWSRGVRATEVRLYKVYGWGSEWFPRYYAFEGGAYPRGTPRVPKSMPLNALYHKEQEYI